MRLLCAAVAFAVSSNATSVSSNAVSASSPLVSWSGRVWQTGDGAISADWAGVSARVSVTNNFTYVRVVVNDTCAGGNKFAVKLVDAQGVADWPVGAFYTEPGQQVYTLFAAAGRLSYWGPTATLAVTKDVEARFTQCAQGVTFLSFVSDGAFLPPPLPTRHVEVIGDSITSGDLVFCTTPWGDRVPVNNSLWTDSWSTSYGSLLCDTFGAACSTVSWGGMGLVAGDVPSWWWPSLPDVYGSALAWAVSLAGPGAPLAYPWNASAAPRTDAVIINIGTNDAAGGRFNNASFLAQYIATYVALVATISGASPGDRHGAAAPAPNFFLAYGPMTTAYAPAVLEVVQQVTALGHRATPLNLTLPGGCHCGHPSDADHLLMAQTARPVIASVMGWA